MTAPHDQRIARLPESMPLSRVLRLLLGLFMIAAITPPLLSASWSGRLRVAAVFAALVVAFIGLSLILIAALRHPGCEVLAFPALILGRGTHLACVLFSPLDWIEGKVVTLFRSAAA